MTVRSIIDDLQLHMLPLLPLVIQEAEWNDPVLTLIGPGWSLASLSPWRVVANSRLVYGWSHADAGDLVWDLCGQSIISLGVQSQLTPVDPVLHLSDGRAIEIFSENAVDPWSIQMSGATFVGSPST